MSQRDNVIGHARGEPPTGVTDRVAVQNQEPPLAMSRVIATLGRAAALGIVILRLGAKAKMLVIFAKARGCQRGTPTLTARMWGLDGHSQSKARPGARAAMICAVRRSPAAPYNPGRV